jgi:hypothetical protein
MLGVLAAVLASAVAGAAGSSSTIVTVVRPFDHGVPRAGLRITATYKGSCAGGSDATDRLDAWRCGFGNLLIDPCFSDPTGGVAYVLCLRRPWGTETIKLVVTGTRGPNTTRRAPTGHPWGIQLRTGARCLFVQGASSELHGVRLNYTCSDGSVLYGDARRGLPWTILRATGDDAEATRRAGIARVWF